MDAREPASSLHHLVFYGNYESMRFLVDRGTDVAIKDYGWNSTARAGLRREGQEDGSVAGGGNQRGNTFVDRLGAPPSARTAALRDRPDGQSYD